jgi:hypothetical protein
LAFCFLALERRSKASLASSAQFAARLAAAQPHRHQTGVLAGGNGTELNANVVAPSFASPMLVPVIVSLAGVCEC